ncbi:MAG: ParA family protein [Gammaproteobacteria bacterium]|nr:ParA family protein [Gammaproteobacteria bacterium]
MRTIMVVNSKGGSGKTTLATNLAGFYASRDQVTVIKDYDPQGSSSEWLKQRPYTMKKIHILSAFKPSSQFVTRAFAMRLPSNAEKLIIDTPAGVDLIKFISTVKSVDKIIIPVSPSSIDIRATAMFIHELLKFKKMHRFNAEIGVVANRADINSPAYRSMKKIFANLDIEFIATLSQNDNYIKAAERGVSLLELDHPAVMKDKAEWAPLVNWVEGEEVVRIEPVTPERHLYAVSMSRESTVG